MTSGITSGQITQLNQLAGSALNKTILTAITKLDPTKEQLQFGVIENGDNFQIAISEEISPIVAEILKRFFSTDFVDEQVSSGYDYFSGYKPNENSIVVQTNKLRELFSGIGYVNQDLLTQVENDKVVLPVGAEGFFSILHWSKVAPTYQAAVEKVLDLLAKAYGGRFTNYRNSELGSNYLRETSKKVRAMEALQQTQNADILLVLAQFGLRHRGRSARRARAVMNGSEFGFGAYEIGIMLLTHPDRLQNVKDLSLYCAGDEFAPNADGDFRAVPVFRFDNGRLWFDACWFGNSFTRYGSASGFLSFPK